MDTLSDGQSVQQESSNTNTDTQFENLPEDCLLEIFSVKSLSPMDLCSIAEICKRFRPIAQRAIGNDVKFYAFTRKYDFSSKKFNYSTGTYSNVERVLRNFGLCLSRVDLKNENVPTQMFLLNLVKTHCGEGLTHLSIHNLQHYYSPLPSEQTPCFRRLKAPQLRQLSVQGKKSLFSELNARVEMDSISVENYGIIFENVFPRLKKFPQCSPLVFCESCQKNSDCINAYLEILKDFITRHTALKSVKLYLRCDRIWSKIIIDTINDNSKDLQELIFYLTDINVSKTFQPVLFEPPQLLKSLETVKLSLMTIESFAGFAPLTALRKLKLNYCRLPADIEQLTCLPQLTQLVLNGCVSDSIYDIAGIIEQSENLEELNLQRLKLCDRPFFLFESDFVKILDIVKGRPNVLKLTSQCAFTWTPRPNDNVELFKCISL